MSFCSCTLFRVSWWNKYHCNYEACVSLIHIKWELSVEILTMFSVLDFFSCGVISVLRNQESVTGRSYCTLLDCLCSWGQVGHVLELIVDWLPTVPPQAKVCIQPWPWNVENKGIWPLYRVSSGNTSSNCLFASLLSFRVTWPLNGKWKSMTRAQ